MSNKHMKAAQNLQYVAEMMGDTATPADAERLIAALQDCDLIPSNPTIGDLCDVDENRFYEFADEAQA